MNRKYKISKLVEVDSANFELEILESKQPVLVAFATLWSRPCHVLETVLDEISSACSDELKVVWINADENPDLGLWYDIRSVPTLLYFVDGNVQSRIVGTATKAAILSKLLAVSTVDIDRKEKTDV